MSDTKDLCRRLLAAIQSDDADAYRGCFTKDGRIWHDFDGFGTHADGAQSVEQNVAMMNWMHRLTTKLKYETLRLEETETGFLETHRLTGTTVEGEDFEGLACVICTVENGKINRLEEFINPASFAALDRAQLAQKKNL